MKKVSVKACCRIDLAGGTLDLWPLYLYQGGLELVNMGIQVFATATITHKAATSRKSPLQIDIKSEDVHFSSSFKNLDELATSLSLTTRKNPLRWVNRIVYYHLSQNARRLSGHYTIETRSDAPPGSGLGGSSVLGVALYQAFEKLFGRKNQGIAQRWQIQQNVRDLEAIEIEHPAGDQDYVPALFGGLNVLSLGVGKRSTERLSDSVAKKLSSHMALLYTGKPHHSGLNNWAIFKSLHEQHHRVKSSLAEIGLLSQQLAQDLRNGDFKNVPNLLNQEWLARCALGPAVNAPVLDKAWSHAKSLGAVARKGCGAGGGGCMMFYFPNSKARDLALKTKLPTHDWKWLSTNPAL